MRGQGKPQSAEGYNHRAAAEKDRTTMKGPKTCTRKRAPPDFHYFLLLHAMIDACSPHFVLCSWVGACCQERAHGLDVTLAGGAQQGSEATLSDNGEWGGVRKGMTLGAWTSMDQGRPSVPRPVTHYLPAHAPGLLPQLIHQRPRRLAVLPSRQHRQQQVKLPQVPGRGCSPLAS